MLNILTITIPIFLLIGVGYCVVLLRIMTKAEVQAIGNFVIYCALPALIIQALAKRPLDEILDITYLLPYGVASLIVFVGVLATRRIVQRKPLGGSALDALGMSVSNSGFIGYPMAVMVMGSVAVVALALNMLVENLLMIPLAIALAEVGTQEGSSFAAALSESVKRLLRNPIVVAIVLGVALSLSGYQLPLALTHAIDMLADASAPTALFVIGGTLYGIKIRGIAGDAVQISLGKLILHPALVLLAFLVFPGTDPVLMTTGVLFASVPMLSVYPIFGHFYGRGNETATALMTATVASFVTISTVIWLLGKSSLFVIP